MNRRQLLTGAAALACGPRIAAAQSGDVTIVRAESGSIELGPDRQAIWGFGGKAPGPAIQLRQGQITKVRFENALPSDAMLQWRGIHASPAWPTPYWARPGAGYDMIVAPSHAGTYSYRCILRDPGSGLDRLYGLALVQETKAVQVDRDVSLIIDDWRMLPPQSDLYRLRKPYLTGNGVSTYDIEVRTNERIRLRLFNAAARHAFVLGFQDHPVRVMAIDGQPAEPFLARDNRIGLAPGNRVDLFVDMTGAPGSSAPVIVENDRDKRPIARFKYGDEAPIRPSPLTDVVYLPESRMPQQIDLKSALRVEMPLAERAPGASVFADWPALAFAPLFKVAVGRPVVLSIPNAMKSIVTIHLHGHSARLLDRLDDGWKPFWLDTWMVEPAEIVRVAFVPQRRGQCVIECQALDRPDHFAAWFDVN